MPVEPVQTVQSALQSFVQVVCLVKAPLQTGHSFWTNPQAAYCEHELQYDGAWLQLESAVPTTQYAYGAQALHEAGTLLHGSEGEGLVPPENPVRQTQPSLVGLTLITVEL